MSYPPPPAGPPTGGPTGWTPPAGAPSGPPQGPPPGFGYPPGPPQWPGAPGGPAGPGGPDRPSGSKKGLIVTLSALAVLLLVGTVVTVVVLLTRDGDDDNSAATDPTTSATSSGSPSASSDGTDSTEGPSASTAPSSGFTPYAPTDDGGDDVHVDVKAADYAGDWNFRFGDVQHQAKRLDSWDYDSCAPVEARNTLTAQRCEYAVQLNYSAKSGKARITHLFLIFDTAAHATAAQASLTDKDFDLREGSTLANYAHGKWNSSTHGNAVLVTIGTSTKDVDEKELKSMVNYMNTDYRVALTFKF